MARSVFNYLLPSEIATYAHTISSVTDEDVAASFITDAERIIDAYLGPWPRFYPTIMLELTANIASGSTTLASSTLGQRRPNYWARGGIYVMVKDNAANSADISARRLLVASDDNAATLDSAFTDVISGGQSLLMRQESVFPRYCDVDAQGDPMMPFILKQAVALQVEFQMQFGSESFGLSDPSVATNDGAELQSVSYGGGYAETRDTRLAGGPTARYIAPKARVLLGRLANSTGLNRT